MSCNSRQNRVVLRDAGGHGSSVAAHCSDLKVFDAEVCTLASHDEWRGNTPKSFDSTVSYLPVAYVDQSGSV